MTMHVVSKTILTTLDTKNARIIFLKPNLNIAKLIFVNRVAIEKLLTFNENVLTYFIHVRKHKIDEILNFEN